MTVLGKTAAKLLLRAKENGGIVTTTVVRGRGVREEDAALAAAAEGLLVQVEHHSGSAPRRSKRGAWVTTRFRETVYRITEAGRAALAGRAT